MMFFSDLANQTCDEQHSNVGTLPTPALHGICSPDQPLSTFIISNEDINGDWNLIIDDDQNGDATTFGTWSIAITESCTPLPTATTLQPTTATPTAPLCNTQCFACGSQSLCEESPNRCSWAGFISKCFDALPTSQPTTENPSPTPTLQQTTTNPTNDPTLEPTFQPTGDPTMEPTTVRRRNLLQNTCNNDCLYCETNLACLFSQAEGGCVFLDDCQPISCDTVCDECADGTECAASSRGCQYDDANQKCEQTPSPTNVPTTGQPSMTPTTGIPTTKQPTTAYPTGTPTSPTIDPYCSYDGDDEYRIYEGDCHGETSRISSVSCGFVFIEDEGLFFPGAYALNSCQNHWANDDYSFKFR